MLVHQVDFVLLFVVIFRQSLLGGTTALKFSVGFGKLSFLLSDAQFKLLDLGRKIRVGATLFIYVPLNLLVFFLVLRLDLFEAF